MKITITQGEAHVVIEAKGAAELARVARVVSAVLGAGAEAEAETEQKRPPATPQRYDMLKARLHDARAEKIADFLRAHPDGLTAPAVARGVQDGDLFRGEKSDCVHIVRRALAADPRFAKTLSGLHVLAETPAE